MSRKLALVIAVTMVFGGCATAQAPGAQERSNLMNNASFEEVDDDAPERWRTQTWNGEAEFDFPETGRTGSRSVMITSEEGADAAWQQELRVRPYSRYKLSAWIKTDDVKATTGRGVLLNLHETSGAETRALTGTSDWTQVELEFDTLDNDSVQVNCLFGGWGLATGTAWFDDFRLELISSKKAEPDITINTAKTAEPISEYIYGQFIEHLGRCIYGGIWAEMLEDRKFYFEITDEYKPYEVDENGRDKEGGDFPILRRSPWQVVGPEGTVAMIPQNSYVGKHTPEITSAGHVYVSEDTPLQTMSGFGEPRGIAQNYLALIEGKEYTGRIVLAGSPEVGPIEVSLVWGAGKDDRSTATIKQIGADFVKYPLSFEAGRATENGRLEIVGRGKGTFRVGTVSLMPADNVNGMRADTLKLLKELDSPVYRWPGGNFVSGYDWKDGIGDPDRRPTLTNPAWTGMEYNDVGINEFIAFCREVDAEPFIAVNTGLGTVESLREEIEYCNGGTDTPMGKWRAENGHPEPFDVKFWAIGNEMYGGWQLGHMSLEDYVKKHNAAAQAMWSVDPSAQLIAVGDAGPWSEGMMANSADHMNLISEHFYCGGQRSVLGHVAQIPRAVKRKATAHREYRKRFDSLNGKDIRIAMDEWNYWYGPHRFGELGVRYHLQDALGIAAGLHEYSRNTDIIFMANYAQTVNVIGCIKTTKTEAAFATTGLVLKLYRKEYGEIPVEVSGEQGLLDIAAAWREDRKTLTIGIVNPTDSAVEVPVKFEGARPSGRARLWVVTGQDKMAYNEPGKPPQVVIAEKSVGVVSDRFVVPPLSVCLYALTMK